MENNRDPSTYQGKRLDYDRVNYCSCCEQPFPKEILRCTNYWCGQKLRTCPITTKYNRKEHVRY